MMMTGGSKLCSAKDEFGRTGFHVAGEEGSVEDMENLLKTCPEFLKEVNGDGETCLLVAMKCGNWLVVECLLKWLGENLHYSDLIGVKDRNGNSVLHLAAAPWHSCIGFVKDIPKNCITTIIKTISEIDPRLCFAKNNDGHTPLHIASMYGPVNIMKMLLDTCPEAVKEVTLEGMSCLHTAVLYENIEVVQYMLNWVGENIIYSHLINAKDRNGNTALLLAVAGRKIQILQALFASNLVDMIALSSDSIGALKTPVGFFNDGIIKEETFPSKAMKEKYFPKTNLASYNSSSRKSRGRGSIIYNHRRRNALEILLLIATITAVVTYFAATHYHPRTRKGDVLTMRSFVLYNSMCFVASVASMVYLLHGFPLKPWPQVSVFTLYAGYMCSIMVISPVEAMVVFVFSIPPLLLAVKGKLFHFNAEV